jgi:hypothetical protein
MSNDLDQELLDLELDGQDLGLEVRALVRGDGGSNDGTRNTAGTTESSLGGDKDIGDVLVLAEERQVEQNLNGLGVGSHDNELGNTTVEGLGGLVGSLLELLVVRGLLNQIHDRVGKSGIGKGPGFGVDFGLFIVARKDQAVWMERCC